jgi:hypothetical protein
MKKVLEYIKSFDYFGHQIVFVFNKKQDNVHRTFFGGLVSFILKLMVITYFILLVIRMATRQYDTCWWYLSSWDNGDDWT